MTMKYLRVIILFIVCVLGANTIYAQDFERDSTYIIKSEVREELSIQSKYTEHYIGVRGGVTGGSIIIVPYFPKYTEWGNLDFGIVYKLLAGDRYLGGFQTEVSYVNNAFALEPRDDSDSSFVRTMTTIEIPFFWHPYYNFDSEGKFRVFFNAGPYLYYMKESKYQYIDDANPDGEYNRGGDYQFNRYLDVRLGYGLLGGVGFEIMLTRRFQLSLEARYKFSFTDIWRYGSKIDPAISEPTTQEYEQMYGYANYAQSQVTQIGISAGLFYKFGAKSGARKVDKKVKAKRLKKERKQTVQNNLP